MLNEKKIQQKYGLRYEPDRFFSRETAFNFARRCEKLHVVMFTGLEGSRRLGVEKGYYVLCPSDAEKLLKATNGLIYYAK